jgi:type II secretory ATPase GspE/PulE/Tfp pilus assembly ATPase PilB-like protein
MVDQGVEPYLVASSIILVIAQRLVRTICPHCKTTSELTDEWIAKLRKLDIKPEMIEGKIAHGAGCDECFHSGFSGRTAIYEFLPVDEVLRTQIMEGATATQMKRSAVERGMITLRMDGREKVLQRLTTPDEILRVTQMDMS